MKKVIPAFLVLLALTGGISTCGFKTGTGNVQAISNAEENENPLRNDAILESIEQSSGKTGTYYYKSGGRLNVMEVQETGKDSLRAAFGGAYEYKSDGEWMQDAGGTDVVAAKLNNQEAELLLEDYPDCRISLKFMGAKLIVRQKEYCGFGGNVGAGAVYVKLNNAVPDFERREFNQEEYDKLPDTPFNAGQIRFPKGASETIVSGAITETQDEAAYIISARKGQTLSVSMLNNGAKVYVIEPDGAELRGRKSSEFNWSYKLPVSGNYKIVVFTIEIETLKYKMRVSIE